MTRENGGMDLFSMGGVAMRRNSTMMALALLALGACNTGRDPIDQVQQNIVDKSIFEGDWFYQETLIKETGDNALFTGEFIGDNLNYDFGTLKGEIGIPGTYPAAENRIRWVIDKDVLIAFRAGEIVVGGNTNANNDQWPLRVGTNVRQAREDDSHIQVGKTGTVIASTGAEATVQWDEGEGKEPRSEVLTRASFLAGNVVADLEGHEFLGEPLAAFPITEHLDIRYGYNPSTGEKTNVRYEDQTDRRWFERRYMRVDWGTNVVSHVINFDGFTDEPASTLVEEGSQWDDRWEPQFVTPTDNPDAPYANEFREDEVYYMSFVTRRVRSPGYYCLFGYGPCSSLIYTVRSSFLKSSPAHEYIGVQEPGTMYDRFGIIRLGIPTYTRGGEPDAHDGIGPDYGETDFVNYWAMRHNMWWRHLNDQGDPLPEDQLWATDNIRGIHYMLNDNYPDYLVRPALEVFRQWNEPFVDMVRRHNGVATTSEGGDPIDCHITGGSGVLADEYEGGELDGGYPDNYEAFAGERNLKMEGSECYVKGEVNPCDVDPNQACVELGDIRYHFFNLIPDPGAAFCGVSIPTADPRSGELISANINTTIECLDNAATRFIDYIKVMRRGELDDAEIISGEDIREYIASDGRVRYPVTPGPEGPLYNANRDGGNGMPSGAPFANPSRFPFDQQLANEMTERLETFRDRNSPEFRAQIFSDAKQSLRGSAMEQALLEMMGQQSVDIVRRGNPRLDIPADATVFDDVVADRISPFRNGGMITALRQTSDAVNPFPGRPGRIYEPPIDLAFDDPNLAAIIDLVPADWSDDQVGVWVRRRILLWVMLHELGHSRGMEHNFGASSDRNNDLDEWYQLDAANPLPRSEDYGLDTQPDAGDLHEYEADTRAARDARDRAGIAQYQYTSVMDYMGLAERINPRLGKYDKAAVSWSYGNQVEIYSGDPRAGSDDFELDGSAVPRQWVTHYNGGETCRAAADCPSFNPDAPISQRCLENPRYERQPQVCGDEDRDCVCSAYEEDVKEASVLGYDCNGDGRMTGGEFSWDCDGDGATDHWPVEYLTCSNDRVSDISWCNMFDRGSTFREVVQNMRDNYNRNYVWRNFRRHNPQFGPFTSAGTIAASMYDAVKIYQHLLYRYFYEEDFAARTGSLGFWDEYLASVDTMNWMASILAQPDVGAYQYGEPVSRPGMDDPIDVLHKSGDEPDGSGDVDLPMGPGKWLWSQHEGDEFGVFDFTRAGTFFDKYLAFEALARREWGLGYLYDERFYVNFYDFFATTMEQLYGGALRGDVLSNAAYYDASNESIVFADVWNGLGDFSGRPERCIHPSSQIPAGMPAVTDNLPLLLREVASAWALAEFAVFYDTSFAQKMYVFVEGSAEGITIPETDPRDGRELEEGVDYIRYTSDTRGKTYVSMQVEAPLRFPGCNSLTYDLDEDGRFEEGEPPVYGSISFALLKDANDAQDLLRAARQDLEDDPGDEQLAAEVERLRLDVANRDSLIELLIDMQRRFGISNYFL